MTQGPPAKEEGAGEGAITTLELNEPHHPQTTIGGVTDISSFSNFSHPLMH